VAIVDVGADEWSCTDKDGDGFSACTLPPDCDDDDPTVHPGAPEICDGKDNNCNCLVDDGVAVDADGDGFTTCGGDCDDSDASVNPGAAEVCDGRDNNCSGSIDEGFLDQCVAGAQAELALGSAFGTAGDTVGIGASLAPLGPGASVSAFEATLRFDPTVLSGPPSCTINPAIGPGTAIDKSLGQNLVSAGELRILLFGVNQTQIPPGDVFSCTLPIASDAGAGTRPITVSAAGTDASGAAVALNGRAGSLTVLGAPGSTPLGIPGDCNGNGTVAVTELQSVVNIFIGSQALATCPAADANGDDSVGIVEIQIAVINLLGL